MRNGSLTEGHELVAGDVVTVTCDDGLFGVMKVLAVDGHGVHARLYVQRFDRRPITAGLGELSTAPFGPDYDNPLSIGHMPLTYEAFAGWQPSPLYREPVLDEELEGYRMWQEADGGYFS